jgi:hypothetical protein
MANILGAVFESRLRPQFGAEPFADLLADANDDLFDTTAPTSCSRTRAAKSRSWARRRRRERQRRGKLGEPSNSLDPESNPLHPSERQRGLSI